MEEKNQRRIKRQKHSSIWMLIIVIVIVILAITSLFIDNKILEKDRQKAIVGEQDGHIIFLYVAGRLYLKKRPENAILYGTVVIYKNF